MIDKLELRRSRWTFRIAAVVFGLCWFIVFEWICSLLNWGNPWDQEDAFVGFSSIHPLFVLSDDKDSMTIPISRRKFFVEESFPADKSTDTFRIFCLGGSTVQGRPYSTQTSFTTWLAIAMQETTPNRNWEIINCGGISYASYRLAPILEEVLTYQPDMIILCSGHNEFLEDRSYSSIKYKPSRFRKVHEFASSFRTFQMIRKTLNGFTSMKKLESGDGDRPVMTADADALLDYHNGIKAYHRDEDWRMDVISHYEYNLRRMQSMCDSADVPLLLMLPPSNLRDSPPFKSQHGDSLNPEALNTWKGHIEKAESLYRDDLDGALQFLKKALDLDDRYAITYYSMGKVLEAKGWFREATNAYEKAREEDVCPLRILKEMEASLRRIAHDTGSPLIDIHKLLEKHCSWNIMSNEMLVDHIHPSIRGHQMIAMEVARSMIEKHNIKVSADWKSQCELSFGKHLKSMSDLYFLKGKQNLENLKAWTQGRADGHPIETRIEFPNP
ncbi:MAG TPA: SGNH/GDSL hydrolase family protein [Verrucomicrobiales bacterium]|nr:SGNH/GDSL hydrolase family protein [Verrucomicrobiales bacterium]